MIGLRNSKYLFALIFIVLISSSVSSFDSPTNSKFEITGDGNVNTHTGDMSFSVPVMTVPGRAGMDFPISLVYASGVKLEQKSSDVGWGWSLNMPSLTRQAVGIPDDYYPYRNGQNEDSKNIFLYDKANLYHSDYEQNLENKKDWYSLGMSAGNLGFFATGIATGGISLASIGVAQGLATYSDVQNVYKGAGGYDLTTVNLVLDSIQNVYQEKGFKGFYHLSQQETFSVDEESILDFSSPDKFVLSGPSYSGEIAYSLDKKTFQAAVSSGNLKNDFDNNNNCPDFDQDCEDAIDIGVELDTQDGSEHYYNFEKFIVTDISGTKYYYEPISKFDLPNSGNNYGTPSTGGQDLNDLGLSFAIDSQGQQISPSKFVKYVRSSNFPSTCDNDESCYYSNLGCGFGNDGNYQERAFLKPYYSTWGLTEIVSIQEKNNIEFEYSDWGDLYQYRTPDDPNNQIYCIETASGGSTWGEQFVRNKQLEKIKTDTHIAHFFWEDRPDLGESFNGDASGDGNNPAKKLASIVLTERNSNTEGATLSQLRSNPTWILQEVVFNNDNTLQGIDRLKLDSVQNFGECGLYGCGVGSVNALPPYKFGYYEAADGEYRPWRYDRWGNYMRDNNYVGFLKHNSEGVTSGDDSYNWNLRRVDLPTGGYYEWRYEQDRYDKVGNYYADPVGSLGQYNTHYGGGNRVSEFISCTNLQGKNECYTTKYIYTEDLNGYNFGTEKELKNGESSGVTVAEPQNHEGWDDSLIPQMGNAYSNIYVGYSDVYEISGYNSQGNNLEESAPYGYTHHSYITSEDQSDTGVYEPPVYFKHPLHERWYGFGIEKSGRVSEPLYGEVDDMGLGNQIELSDYYYTIPIEKPFMVYGPPGAKLRFVFKIPISDDGNNNEWGGPGTKGGYAYLDVQLPQESSSLCNTEKNVAQERDLVCTTAYLSNVAAIHSDPNAQIETTTLAQGMVPGQANCQDSFDCPTIAAVYDITEAGTYDGLDDKGFPVNSDKPIFNFVWSQDAFISCSTDFPATDRIGSCTCSDSRTHKIKDANYKFAADKLSDSQLPLLLLGFDKDSENQCINDFNSPIYKKFDFLSCTDRDGDKICDYIDGDYVQTKSQNPALGIDVDERYSGAVSNDYLRGLVKSTKVYDSNSNLISSNTPSYENRQSLISTDEGGNVVRKPLIWNVKTSDEILQEGRVTKTSYDYEINGLPSELQILDDQDNLLHKTITTYAFIDSSSAQQQDLMDNHEWDKVHRTTIRDENNNRMSESITTWKKCEDQNTGILCGGNGHVVAKESILLDNDMQDVVSYESYDVFGRPYHIKTYQEFDTGFGQNHIENNGYFFYGDNNLDCYDLLQTNPYGSFDNELEAYPNGNDFKHAYLTCSMSCDESNNNCRTTQDLDKLHVSTAEYNELGLIEKIIGENNEETSFTYDGLYRLREVITPGEISPITSYDYSYALHTGNYILSEENLNSLRTTVYYDDVDTLSVSRYDGLARENRVQLVDDVDCLYSSVSYNDLGLPDQSSKAYRDVCEDYQLGFRNPGKSFSPEFNEGIKYSNSYLELIQSFGQNQIRGSPLARIEVAQNNDDSCVPIDLGNGVVGKCCGTVIEGSNGQLTCAGGGVGDANTCGNGIRENFEACDGNDFLGSWDSCSSYLGPGWTGPISCNSDCTINENQCTNVEGYVLSKTIYEDTPLTRVKEAYPFGEYPSGIKVENNYGGWTKYSYATSVDENGNYLTSYTNQLGNLIETDANNMILNPNFELGNNGDTSIYGWEPVNSQGTQQISTQRSHHGDKSLKLTKTQDLGLSFRAKQNLDLFKPGEDYIASAWVYVENYNGQYGASLGLTCKESGGSNAIGTSPGTTSTTGSWVKLETGVLQVPQVYNAEECYLSLFVSESGSSGTVYLDQVQVEKSNEVTPWSGSLNEYDALGRVLKTTLPNNQEITYTYDELSRLKTRTDPDRGLISYEYFDNGLTKFVQDQIKKTRFVYDALGRVLEVYIDPNGAQGEYLLAKNYYDESVDGLGCTLGYEKGKLCKVENLEHNTKVYYEYDEKGNIIRTIQDFNGEQFKVDYSYDRTGTLKEVNVENGKLITSREFNKLGQISGFTTATDSIPQETVNYEYDDQGLVDSINYPNGVTSEFEYNLRDWVENIKHEYSPTNVFFEQDYSYDPAGNLVGLGAIQPSELGATYEYDNLYRLKEVNDFGFYGGSLAEDYITYEYDELGNRVARGGSYDQDNYNYISGTSRLDSSDDCSYSYYDNGNTMEMNCNGESMQFTYDGSDSIIRTDYWDGSYDEFNYDPLGRRVYKKHVDSLGQTTSETYYYYGLENTPYKDRVI